MISKRPRGTGSVFQLKGRTTWWIKYHRNGKPVRESSGSAKVKDGKKLLTKRLGEVCNGTIVEPRDRRVTVDDLYTSLIANYRNNGLASLEGAEQRWKKRLEKQFGGWRAVNVSTAALDRYLDSCLAKKLSNGTVNRDLAAL